MKRLIVVALTVAGCVTTGSNVHPPLTPAEEADLARAMQTPLTFEIATDDAVTAWGRAQTFVHKFSKMKIQTATEFILETYNINCEYTAGARYIVRKVPVTKDAFRIEVDCTGCWLPREQVLINAHVAAHYVRTGELVCDRQGFNACIVQ